MTAVDIDVLNTWPAQSSAETPILRSHRTGLTNAANEG